MDSQKFPRDRLSVFRHLVSLIEDAQTMARSSAYAMIQMDARRRVRGVCDGKAGDGKSDQTMEKASVNRNGERTDPDKRQRETSRS
jgi:hypothetical protein